MLILSRRVGESIYLPSIDATVTVQKTSAGRVVLGIDAPPDVPVVRHELAETTTADDPREPAAEAKPNRPLLAVRQPASGYAICAPSVGIA